MRQRKVAHTGEEILREEWTFHFLIMDVVSGNDMWTEPKATGVMSV